MNMKTLFVDYDLAGQVEKGIQIASLGRNRLSQKIPKKEYFKKLFKRHRLPFDKKNIKEKLDKLLDAFKATKNIEIIQKSTTGKEFRNFIKTNLEGQKNYKSINKIAFIARFENDIPQIMQKKSS